MQQETYVISQGATEETTFTLPFDTSLIETGKGTITYEQKDVNGKIIYSVTKKIKHCTCNAKTITTNLSQIETLGLCPKYPVQIQLKLKMKDTEEVITSNIITASVNPCLCELVI